MRDGQSVPQLPGVLPGQIWLVEHDIGMPLSAVDRAVLAAANVVLYDRALASLVAQLLPLGAYAEPLPGVEVATGPAITPRALDFAAEGWSVVELVAAGPAWRARLAALPPALLRAGRNGALPVRVLAKDSGGHEREFDAGRDEFPELIRGFGDNERLTLIFGPLATPRPAPAHAFTANGLAG
jgi:hypothetical protein